MKKNGEIEKKIPDISGLVTADAFNTKIDEVEKKFLILVV